MFELLSNSIPQRIYSYQSQLRYKISGLDCPRDQECTVSPIFNCWYLHMRHGEADSEDLECTYYATCYRKQYRDDLERKFVRNLRANENLN